jgi:hypothetical protein
MYKLVNGKKVKMTAAEIKEREAEEAINIAEMSSTKYIRDRQREYPSITDQLDLLYHGGITAWRAEIKAIKDKYPKPS